MYDKNAVRVGNQPKSNDVMNELNGFTINIPKP